MSDVKTQLSEEIAEVYWEDLIPHVKQDRVIIVNQSLNLLDAGLALANNDTKLVNKWIENNIISKPTQQQLSNWNSMPKTKFETIIVQPFVLITLLSM